MSPKVTCCEFYNARQCHNRMGNVGLTNNNKAWDKGRNNRYWAEQGWEQRNGIRTQCELGNQRKQRKWAVAAQVGVQRAGNNGATTR